MNRLAWIASLAIAVILVAASVFGAAAVANVAIPCGIVIAIWQVVDSRRQAGLNFEDQFAREYRDVIESLPAEALLGRKLSKEDQAESRKSFFRYFDLCNHQAFMFEKSRINEQAWSEWVDGIRDNMRLPAFERAWTEIKAARPDSFEGLRRLEANGFVVVRKPVASLRLHEEPAPVEEARKVA
jgi:hypothetical protein